MGLELRTFHFICWGSPAGRRGKKGLLFQLLMLVLQHACSMMLKSPPPLPPLPVLTQVFGGLVTGMVVKYCDNILKNFALAISVILTVLVVIPLFGQVGSLRSAGSL